VVVSAKVSKRAVRRNRLRRLLHEWLTRACAGVPEQRRGTWVLLSLKPASLDAPPERLLGECDLLFQKAGLCP
jgi:ribonuclease P protein component